MMHPQCPISAEVTVGQRPLAPPPALFSRLPLLADLWGCRHAFFAVLSAHSTESIVSSWSSHFGAIRFLVNDAEPLLSTRDAEETCRPAGTLKGRHPNSHSEFKNPGPRSFNF